MRLGCQQKGHNLGQDPIRSEPWPVLSNEEWEQKVKEFLSTTYTPDEETLRELGTLTPEERYIQLLLIHGFVSYRKVNPRGGSNVS